MGDTFTYMFRFAAGVNKVMYGYVSISSTGKEAEIKCMSERSKVQESRNSDPETINPLFTVNGFFLWI